jgi:hypothetical protein
MKRILVLLLAVFAISTFQETPANAQDLKHYKKIVKELSSKKYQGRGYAKHGANKAGKYLVKEFEKAGADAVECQSFTIDINTFCGKMDMWTDGKKLTPGVDFSMREYSPGVHGEFPVYHVDTLNFDAEKMYEDLAKPEYDGCMVVCDFWFMYKHKEFKPLHKKDSSVGGFIQTWTSPIKFYKAYGSKVMGKPIVWVTPEAIEGVKNVKLDVDNEWLQGYELFNVIAKVNGERHDSCFVFTAHYDHLGNLGKKVYYPGANDNASGTAAIVTLAEYYAQNKPEYDMYFIAFSGEDSGLNGSMFYVDNPVVPLAEIRYLFNLDMIGDNNPVQYCEVSDEGNRGYALMEKINGEKHYFEGLNRGELAANSDHYPFAERHVPCILFENENGDAFQYYHTIYDTYENGIFVSYEPIFKIITDFVEKY